MHMVRSFQRIASNRQLPSNIAEAYTCAEEHTGNPCPDRHAFLRDPPHKRKFLSCSVQTENGGRVFNRRWHQLRFEAQDEAHPGQSDDGRQEESGPRAVDEVP